MTLDLAALKATAEAATQGKWEQDPEHSGEVIIGDYTVFELSREDAAHIAAFDPPTCLELVARAEQADALEAELGGVRHAEPEREKLGMLVRAAWVRYCKESGDTKTSHITPWEGISEWDKEADRRIGEAIASWFDAERDQLKAQVSAMREAVGPEWPIADFGKWGKVGVCQECSMPETRGAHLDGCTRGRFYAALAAQEREAKSR